MNFSPFSCPIFLGHPEARGRCSQSERLLFGRDLRRSGGTGKAEAVKLPGAGIGPSSAQENEWGKKPGAPNSVTLTMGVGGVRRASQRRGSELRACRGREEWLKEQHETLQ